MKVVIDDCRLERMDTYTDPLNDKIKRQAAEITRMLAENAELKEQLNQTAGFCIEQVRIAKTNGQQEAGRLIELPCKIGDTVYGIRSYKGVRKVQSGVVSEMYFSQKNRLIIVIKHICRGYWGENIFGSLEEAEAALKERG